MELTVDKDRTMQSNDMDIRNRILEVLELISNRQAQLEYQRKAPSVAVSTEIFSQWEDWYHPGSRSFDEAFDDAALAALAEFNLVFEAACGETPQMLPPLADFIETSIWARYRDGAQKALLSMHSDSGRMGD